MARELGCGTGFVRAMLLLLNILFVIFGLALVGLGIYMKVDTNFSAVLNELASVSDFKTQSLGYFPFILIGGGVLVVLIALLGCMGSLWCNRCMLYMYATAAIILMILQLIGFGMAVGYKKKLETVYHDGLKKVFTKALAQNETKVLEAFHKLEDTVKCCGVDGVTDYPTGLTPTSCWQHTDGCATVIINVLEKNLPIIGGSLGGVLVLELLCLIFTLILAKNLAHAKEETYSSNPGEVIRELVPGRRANYRKF